MIEKFDSKQLPLATTSILGQAPRGFTLMELMIVMAIIAIASAVIIPRIGSSDGKLYQAQLRTLTATLNFNRRNAVISNRPFEMRLFPYEESYAEQEPSADQEPNEEPSASTSEQAQNSRSTKNKGDWKSQGADIEWQRDSKTIRNKVFSVKFFPQGGATGGLIKLQQGRFIAHLSIDSITGKTAIKESSEQDND